MGTAALGCPVEQRSTASYRSVEERPFKGRVRTPPRRGLRLPAAQMRATVWPSASTKRSKFGAQLFRPREGGRQKIEKRSFLEVLALKVPFRNLLVFPNQAPWPGRFRDSNPCKPLDAGRARELQKSAQPATQMLSMNCLYQMNVSLRNKKFSEVTSLPVWFYNGLVAIRTTPILRAVNADLSPRG